MADGEEMSQEDRIQWLRDRGIQIHIPGEKKTPGSGEDSVRNTTLVKIPYDERLPFTELTVEVPVAQGDQFIEVLKPFFSDQSTELDLAALKETASKQFGNDEVKVSSSALSKLASQGAVEAFTLAYPCEDNNYCCVSLYLDEVGQVRKRKTTLACCKTGKFPWKGGSCLLIFN